MKVRFLKDGLMAHSEPGRGNFERVKGKTMSGLAEETVKNMISSGAAELIGPDDEEESTDGDKESSKSDENTDGETGATGKPDDNGGKKPWATN